jgi:hypothetical protein
MATPVHEMSSLYRANAATVEEISASADTDSIEPGVQVRMERLYEYIRGNRSLAPLGLTVLLVLFYALSPYLPHEIKQYLSGILR